MLGLKSRILCLLVVVAISNVVVGKFKLHSVLADSSRIILNSSHSH
jgi:hypothetical protein